MRVTGGSVGGHRLKVPKGQHVRPTQDRVREALFSILGPGIADGGFLDLYAGSGAVGLDAWSRGADPVCWVERDRRVLPILKENVRSVTGEREGVYAADVKSFLKKGLVPGRFAIIFADPPYQNQGRLSVRKAGKNPQQSLLDAVAASQLLADRGVVVLEQPAAVEATGHSGWTKVDERVYGVARLRFFRAENGRDDRECIDDKDGDLCRDV